MPTLRASLESHLGHKETGIAQKLFFAIPFLLIPACCSVTRTCSGLPQTIVVSPSQSRAYSGSHQTCSCHLHQFFSFPAASHSHARPQSVIHTAHLRRLLAWEGITKTKPNPPTRTAEAGWAFTTIGRANSDGACAHLLGAKACGQESLERERLCAEEAAAAFDAALPVVEASL